MVVEAVSRIFWYPYKRIPLGQTPFVLEDASSGCLPNRNAEPVTSLTAIDPDTVRVLYHDSGVSRFLLREEINRENLEVHGIFPLTRALIGHSTRVQWRPDQRRGR